MTVRALLAAVGVVLLVVLSACAGDDEGEGGGGGGSLVIDIEEQNGSGQFGTATLTAEDERTQVLIETQSPFGRDAQPAHIHRGTCANLDPEPAYALPNLVDGLGGETVDVPLDELRGADFAINIHRSVEQPELYTACGNIK